MKFEVFNIMMQQPGIKDKKGQVDDVLASRQKSLALQSQIRNNADELSSALGKIV